MSAICGVVGTDGRPFAARELAGVMRGLRPLGAGAGAEGVWAGSAGRCGVALGACGVEPARSEDGALSVVADAVLDCRADLRAVLRMPASAPDAELILAAYARWGEGCLEHLSGAFAFALADARRGGVLIARDQIGARPLQIHERRGVVAFATTALSLCALDGVGHELDRVRVGEWLALDVSTERSFVAGVTTLPAASCAWIDAAGVRRRRYWSLDPARFVERASPAAYAGELRDAFDSAVERRLPPNAAAGVLLSGGLDSTSVAATAARLRPGEPVRTYTAVPAPGWRGPVAAGIDADESPLVRELAAWHPNLRPAFVTGDDAPLLAGLDARFAAGSPPPRNPCNELWIAAAQRRAAADGVLTLLTGNRGNAFFSADDPYWLGALLAHGRFADAAREAATLGVRGAARELARQLLPGAALRMRSEVRARRAGVQGLRFAGRSSEAVVRARSAALAPLPPREWRAQAARAIGYSGFIAEAGAVRDALHGIHASDPTGDIRVIEVCATQPPWVRRRGGRTRVVARDAMADRLPPSIAERTRRGAQLPDWFELMTARRAELAEELAAAREHAVCRELLDLDAIGGTLDDWPDPARARARWRRTTQLYRYDLLRALCMCRYLRFFESHAGATAPAPPT